MAEVKSISFSEDLPANRNGDVEMNWITPSNDMSATKLQSAVIRIRIGLKGSELLSTLVHESFHLTQSNVFAGDFMKELDAHAYEEGYRIKSGFPRGGPGFRTKVNGVVVPDRHGIADWLENTVKMRRF
jgi:hypothetical protein